MAVVKKIAAKKVEKLVNNVALVIDESGSMGWLGENVKKVVNKWVADFKKENANFNQTTFLSLYKFANTVQFEYQNEDINDVKNFTNYSPNGGTALFTGVKTAVENLDIIDRANKGNNSFLVIVITDGYENQSGEFNIEVAKKYITDRQNKGNWTFVFLLPPGNAKTFIKEYNVLSDNVREWEATAEGLKKAEEKTSGGINTYYTTRSTGLQSTSTFFKPIDLSKVKPSDVQRKLDDISGECKLYEVKEEAVIQEFVEKKTRRAYVKGSSFYQLTKKELVQPDKQILVMEYGKTAIYGGEQARNLIGLPIGQNAKVDIKNLANYTVYVQSNSVNRKLPRGTKLIVKV